MDPEYWNQQNESAEEKAKRLAAQRETVSNLYAMCQEIASRYAGYDPLKEMGYDRKWEPTGKDGGTWRFS